MKEKIEGYIKEVNSISQVLEKLVTKQNSMVFDKLCDKCNTLFMDISSNDPKSMSRDEIHSIIDVLKSLLACCQKLKVYKEYLISVIENNIQTLQSEIVSRPEELVPQIENDNVMKLEYSNKEMKDAA